METAHSQQQREQILSVHRRHRGRCAGCGQSWPCTERSSVEPPDTPVWRRIAGWVALATVVVGLAVAVGLAFVAGSQS